MPEPRKRASQTRKSVPRTDLTAKRRAEQQAQLTEEQLAEQERISTATAEKEVEDSTTIDDYTGEGVTEEELAQHGVTDVVEHDVGVKGYEEPVEEIDDFTEEGKAKAAAQQQVVAEEAEVELRDATEIVRPREDCQFMLGAGNHYYFSAGRRCEGPQARRRSHAREGTDLGLRSRHDHGNAPDQLRQRHPLCGCRQLRHLHLLVGVRQPAGGGGVGHHQVDPRSLR